MKLIERHLSDLRGFQLLTIFEDENLHVIGLGGHSPHIALLEVEKPQEAVVLHVIILRDHSHKVDVLEFLTGLFLEVTSNYHERHQIALLGGRT